MTATSPATSPRPEYTDIGKALGTDYFLLRAELTEDERDYLERTRRFAEDEVMPQINPYWERAEVPLDLCRRLGELGLVGDGIDGYGCPPMSSTAAGLIAMELNRGDGSLGTFLGVQAGLAMRSIHMHGSEEQKQRWLPAMARCEKLGAFALTEPRHGSDSVSLETEARRDGDEYVINGSKTWITNARRSGLVALLCKTDPAARPAHAGISIVLAEPGDGFVVSRDLPKLGYKGVESCELTFDDFRVPATALLGEREGEGFAQMMRGLEIGRIQVASRALGVGQAALEDALRYAQLREAFGKPIWKHQSIGNYLADMATKLTAARQLVLYAARCYDSGRRADLEAGMAKLFASETAMEIALDAVRIHGGYGYSTEFDVERYFRDAPLMIVGEGTNEIQRNVIARQLIQRYPADR
jgi:alkylation response protein AidB-like acyl-CoA dehydrogenase